MFATHLVTVFCDNLRGTPLSNLDAVICTIDCPCPLTRENSHLINWIVPRDLVMEGLPRLDSNVYEYELSNTQDIEVHEIYSVKSTQIIRNQLATWRTLTRYLEMNDVEKYERRTDLKQALLAGVIELYPGFCEYINETASSGYYSDVMNLLASKLNFTFTTSLSPERVFDGRLPNGTWIGNLMTF